MSGNEPLTDTAVDSPTADGKSAEGRTVAPTGARLKAGFPSRVSGHSWPSTCLDRAAVLERVFSAPFKLENSSSQRLRTAGALAMLGWLSSFPGETWQQRWEASGAEASTDWRDLFIAESRDQGSDGTPPPLSVGLLVLICADVIRPSLGWLLRFAPVRRSLGLEMARTRDSQVFSAMNCTCVTEQVGLQAGQQALTHIAAIMAAKGGRVANIEVGDCVELQEITARLPKNSHGFIRSPLFYQLLRWHGVLGEEAPAALEMFSVNGQPTCEQLIDRYDIKCRPVRDLLVDYLRERQMAMDFSSLKQVAYLVGKLFWADLEAHHPGIDSLKLPRDISASWKQRVMTLTRTTTSPNGAVIQRTEERLDGLSVLSAVRAFYLDLSEWADDDPARWGPWAVRSPVNATDVSHRKSKLARKSRTDQRTRERLPVLPALVSWVQS